MSVSLRSLSSKIGAFGPLKIASASRTYFTYVNEPAQPIKGKEPKWVTPEEAFQDLQSSKCLFSSLFTQDKYQKLCSISHGQYTNYHGWTLFM